MRVWWFVGEEHQQRRGETISMIIKNTHSSLENAERGLRHYSRNSATTSCSNEIMQNHLTD
jgi:hypothetical protein